MKPYKIIGLFSISFLCLIFGGKAVYADNIFGDWYDDEVVSEHAVPPQPPIPADVVDYPLSSSLLQMTWGDNIFLSPVSDFEGFIAPANSDEMLKPIERVNDDWWKILYNGKEAYVSSSYVEEKNTIKISPTDEYRASIVNYALQFVGSAYVYGGSNPETGMDCSGFTSYVLKQAAGIDITRSTQTQAQQGVEIDISQIRPGDLVFYGAGRDSINHVSLYIGDGKIVHAANGLMGVCVMPWWERSYWVKIVNVLGEQ